MTIQITIIGLGQIGASIGLALSSQKEMIRRVGHDKDRTSPSAPGNLGAVDHVELTCTLRCKAPTWCCSPCPPTRSAKPWSSIAEDLKEGAVVMDTSTRQRNRLRPGPAELSRQKRALCWLDPGAQSGLPARTILAWMPPAPTCSMAADGHCWPRPNADSAAIKLAADLTRLLGA